MGSVEKVLLLWYNRDVLVLFKPGGELWKINRENHMDICLSSLWMRDVT